MFLDSFRSQGFQTLLRWAMYAFVGSFPFFFYPNYLFYGTTSRSLNLVMLVEIMTIALGFALIDKNKTLKIIRSPITLALALLLAVSFIASFGGVDFVTSFWSKATRMTGLFYFIHIAFFYLFLLLVFYEEEHLKNFLKVFLISAGIFSLGALLSKDGLDLIFTTRKWTGFTFGNSSFAAMYLYAAFLASIYYVIGFLREKKWWMNLLPLIFVINPYFINVGLWLGNINISKDLIALIGEAQASWVAMSVAVLLLLVSWLVSKIKVARVKVWLVWGLAALGVICAALATYSFLPTGGYLQQIYLKQVSREVAHLNQTSSARPIIWSLSKKSINERPLLGWGVDNFDRAFEKNYDNRILEQKNGAEAWFDRAHNIFIDQTVETGYLGLAAYILVYLSVFGSMLYIVLKAPEKKHRQLAVVLSAYFIGHIIELQTGFDTTISYVAFAVMLALAANLFHKVYYAPNKEGGVWPMPRSVQYGVGVMLILFFGALAFMGTIPTIRAQNANAKARVAGSTEKRLLIYPTLFASHLDKATLLWRTTYDFQRGISNKPELLADPVKRAGLAEELAVFTEEYRRYANAHPIDYRIRVSLAGAYINERLLEVDHLNEAHVVLDDAIKLSPQIPQAYWMKAVVYLYQGKFKLAREWARKAYDLNPGIEQSRKIIDYIEESISTFPQINFFTFGQI